MAEQTIIQVRVDAELKEQVAAIYDRIGIDIPTAVRMFFKATVRDNDLPFSTAAREPKNLSAAEKFLDFVKGIAMYEPPPAGSDDTIAVLPLKNGYEIPAAMFVQLVSLVPEGKITCWEDIFKVLGRIYRREVTDFPSGSLPMIDTDGNAIPYWRVVSGRGILSDGRAGSREAQRERLIDEGIPVVRRGSLENSYKVDNYRDYMFDFSGLKIVKEPVW